MALTSIKIVKDNNNNNNKVLNYLKNVQHLTANSRFSLGRFRVPHSTSVDANFFSRFNEIPDSTANSLNFRYWRI